MRKHSFLLFGLLFLFIGGLYFLSRLEVRDSDNIKLAQLLIEKLCSRLESFRVDCGRYPTTDEGLAALLRPPKDKGTAIRWRGPYLPFPQDSFLQDVLRDCWGRTPCYRFRGGRSGKEYDVFSLSWDGVESSDDIGNW